MKFKVLTAICVALGMTAAAQADPQPKLVLQITVDGLRADLLSRYEANFTTGGFRYLLDHGTVYGSAHYDHANTETIVGH
ncbi:MAG: alkaline phosphatase family protein, partial [Deltaproteobacteria bacterium]|nr:alkaline phosphatase family protein [Deltaproteobacteria bacterium]